MDNKTVDSSRVDVHRAWCPDCKRELVNAGKAAGFSVDFVHGVVCVPDWAGQPWGHVG